MIKLGLSQAQQRYSLAMTANYAVITVSYLLGCLTIKLATYQS